MALSLVSMRVCAPARAPARRSTAARPAVTHRCGLACTCAAQQGGAGGMSKAAAKRARRKARAEEQRKQHEQAVEMSVHKQRGRAIARHQEYTACIQSCPPGDPACLEECRVEWA
mmetsp:Transcript_11750/g.40885  ORF Transcript_11750/g.40885 Transcript_11750/m.40885 type:complete len:115 (+) Transcript_11750:145-489(+)